MNEELTVADVIAWNTRDDGTGADAAKRARVNHGGRWHTGYLTTSPMPGRERLYIRDSSRGSRSQYQGVHQRDIDAGAVQVPGAAGRYVDIREALRA